MIIVNADDLGRSRPETDAALSCYALRRITSASAMVFMEDSERAAELAKNSGLDIGLHLNLDESFTASSVAPELKMQHESIVRFLKNKKRAQILYIPFLRGKMRAVYAAQEKEFIRLFGRHPSHVDGHRHKHLCANMVIDRIIPAGNRVRRSFSFSSGEKGALNRAYRGWIDKRLKGSYDLTDYFYCLNQCLRKQKLDQVIELSKTSTVELMTHPKVALEYDFLTGNGFNEKFIGVKFGSYSQISASGTAA